MKVSGAGMGSETLSVEEAKAYIDGIDFSMIIGKMVSDQGWRKREATATCELYRHFLFLIKKYPEKALPPSEDIDEFWHNHILDTQKYYQDCLVIFGRYLHHNPYLGIDAKTSLNGVYSSFDLTQQLHHSEFGTYIYKVKGVWFSRIFDLLQKMRFFRAAFAKHERSVHGF